MILLILIFDPHIFSKRKGSSWASFFFLPGGIAVVVGILDEIHQAFIPDREGSISDVILDIVGIALFGILIHFYNTRLKPHFFLTKKREIQDYGHEIRTRSRHFLNN